MINLYNMDCMKFMADKPDDYYELAIVDPEYGIKQDGGAIRARKNDNWINTTIANKKMKKCWDSKPPKQEYFTELIRISKNQIIWGGNYFTDKLPVSRCWIYWRKLMGGDFSDGELAWTSFNKVVKEFTKCNKQHNRQHPCQKPIKLYEWLLENYTKKDDKILDTHGGSMSSVIACINMQFNIDCCELDKDYFKDAVNRIQKHAMQLDLFRKQPIINIHKELTCDRLKKN